MKSFLLLIVFILIVGSPAFCQELSPSAEKRISLITRVMATELRLNEGEYIKLKALNRDRILKADEIATIYSGDAETATKKLYELEASFDKKLKAMLNPDQLEMYAAYNHSPASNLALSGTKKVNPTASKNP